MADTRKHLTLVHDAVAAVPPPRRFNAVPTVAPKWWRDVVLDRRRRTFDMNHYDPRDLHHAIERRLLVPVGRRCPACGVVAAFANHVAGGHHCQCCAPKVCDCTRPCVCAARARRQEASRGA